tara:strand:- start:8 stop:193 length:186 start_codon:yes stop_codon:yes gene_type:complete
VPGSGGYRFKKKNSYFFLTKKRDIKKPSAMKWFQRKIAYALQVKTIIIINMSEARHKLSLF